MIQTEGGNSPLLESNSSSWRLFLGPRARPCSSHVTRRAFPSPSRAPPHTCPHHVLHSVLHTPPMCPIMLPTTTARPMVLCARLSRALPRPPWPEDGWLRLGRSHELLLAAPERNARVHGGRPGTKERLGRSLREVPGVTSPGRVAGLVLCAWWGTPGLRESGEGTAPQSGRGPRRVRGQGPGVRVRWEGSAACFVSPQVSVPEVESVDAGRFRGPGCAEGRHPRGCR